MNIVVLDGFTLNPGDLSWEALQSLGNCTIYDRSNPAEARERAAKAAIVLTNKVPVGRDLIPALPLLRYIGVTATGYNIIDVAAAKEHNVVVTHVPAYGTRSVAQLTLALLLELTQNAGLHSRGVQEGRWSRSPDWSYSEKPLVELDGLTLGLVGYGRIGQAVGQLGQALGMKVIAAVSGRNKPPHNVPVVDLDYLFGASDVISLHCPLTPETQQLVNAQRLARMKPTAFLLNTSRGPLVDEKALAEALNSGRIAGAGLDVLSQEPPPADHPLLAAKNCIITPHLAWATKAARQRLMTVAVENVRSFLAGKPANVVSA